MGMADFCVMKIKHDRYEKNEKSVLNKAALAEMWTVRTIGSTDASWHGPNPCSREILAGGEKGGQYALGLTAFEFEGQGLGKDELCEVDVGEGKKVTAVTQ
ncbi:hypothetical protein B0H12DRAFT_1068292 [Mycena haematopus]|nr:hypothetical protein B0H12DRAFT_1068292 [Mycena haematopus]